MPAAITRPVAGAATQPTARAIAAAVANGQARVLEGQGHGAADDVIIPVLTEFFA
jgi:hypothetical protein